MYEEFELDLAGKSIKTLTKDEIPPNTTSLILTNNNISTLPSDIFHTKFKLWNINLSYNSLNSIKFLNCFGSLGILDLRHNQLMLEDLLEIRHINILFLYLGDNLFQKSMGEMSLALPALFKKAWTIDGMFISDDIRKRSKEYKRTISFSEALLSARRNQVAINQRECVSTTVSSLLAGNKFHIRDSSKFLSTNGVKTEQMIKKTQIERLTFLAGSYNNLHSTKSNLSCFRLPEGNFYNYLAITLGILSVHWMNIPLALAPRVISRAYWSAISDDLLKFENWEQWIVLKEINCRIQPKDENEIKLWKKINLEHYIMKGEIPKFGSFPRFLISSVIYRNPDLSEEILASEDMRLYLKFRNSANFGAPDLDFDMIYFEVFGKLPFNPILKAPKKNDVVAIKHPITNKWVNSRVKQVLNGRAYLKVDEYTLQMALTSIFWDGRGVYRENQRVEDLDLPELEINISQKKDFLPYRPLSALTPIRKRGKTFITVVDSAKDAESLKQNTKKLGVPLPPCAIPKKNVIPKDDPSFFLRTSQNLMNTSPFIDRKKYVSPNFRGIVDPHPQPKTIHLKARPTKRPTQVVDSVVNIALGQEVGPDRRVRKFLVRVINTNSQKASYIWINEDEIPEADVQRLVNLYKEHISSKMVIV